MLILLNVLLVFSTVISGKYLEGELKTNDVRLLPTYTEYTYIPSFVSLLRIFRTGRS